MSTADDDIEEPAGADAPKEESSTSLSRTKTRLRRLLGRREPYRGPIIAISRGWVSRDTRMRFLAARFLDFVVLTEEHLVLCSTGFFTRRPRRLVLREPLVKLRVVGRGPEPQRRFSLMGDFDHPILVELRPIPSADDFARELVARCGQHISMVTRADPAAPAATDVDPPDESAPSP